MNYEGELRMMCRTDRIKGISKNSPFHLLWRGFKGEVKQRKEFL